MLQGLFVVSDYAVAKIFDDQIYKDGRNRGEQGDICYAEYINHRCRAGENYIELLALYLACCEFISQIKSILQYHDNKTTKH